MSNKASKHPTNITWLILLLTSLLWLSACGTGDGRNLSKPVSGGQITGTVLLPSQQVTLRPASTFLTQLVDILIPQVIADVTGLVPVASATVELVRLDSQGNVISVIDTTTSDGSGIYTFTTTLLPDSTLAVRLPNEPVTTRAIVTDSTTDISPVSEAVIRAIVNEIVAVPTTVIENFTLTEIISMVDLVNGMDIDVSGAADFDAAVVTVEGEAGSTLTDLSTGFSGAETSYLFRDRNYGLTGLELILADPSVNATVGGVYGQTTDGGYLGFTSVGTPWSGSLAYLNPLYHDLNSVSLVEPQLPGLGANYYSVTTKGLLSTGIAGSPANGGFVLSNDGFINPLFAHVTESIDSNGEHAGYGIRLGFEQHDTVTSTDVADAGYASNINWYLNDRIKGVFNWLAIEQHLSGKVSTIGNGSSTIELLSATGTLTVANNSTGADNFENITFTPATSYPTSLNIDTANLTTPSSSITTPGKYQLFQQGSLLLQGADGSFHGNGLASRGGNIFSYSISRSNIFQHELFVTVNDSDNDVGDSIFISAVGTPDNGGSVTNKGESLIYSPAHTFSGTETFNYTLTDGTDSSVGTVTITVENVNVAPTGVADAYNININTNSSNNILKVLDNDDDALGDILIIDSGTLGTPSNGGTVTISADSKSLDYSPAAAYSGVETFTYIAKDRAGSLSAATMVTLTVAADTAPTSLPDSYDVKIDSVNNVLNVLDNDEDAIGDTLTITAGSLVLGTPANGSSVAISADSKSVLYSPGTAFTGMETFTYTATDGTTPGSATTVTINVDNTNAVPAAVADSYSINNNNQGNRGLAIALKQTSIARTDISGTYNVVHTINRLASDGLGNAGVESEYQYGTMIFDGAGAITGGELHRKTASLDVDQALIAQTSLSTSSAKITLGAAAGSYTVNSITGTVNISSLTIGTETFSGDGAATADGQFVALVLKENPASTTQTSRSMLLLSRQLPPI